MAVQPIDLQITGMRCANCAARLEKILNQLPEVTAKVNIATEKASLNFDPQQSSLESVVQAIQNAGFNAHRIRDFAAEKKARFIAYQREKYTFLVSALLSAPMLLEMLWMFAQTEQHHTLLPLWLTWLLATPVQFIIGWRFYRGAWFSLRSGGANMDVLVALGTSAAYFYSCVVWLQRLDLPVYFESSATLITLILLGKLLEARAKGKASSALEALMNLQPKLAHVERDDCKQDIAVELMSKGDIFWVRAGESVPVDGVVLEGVSSIDEAMLSGESLPQNKQAGDKVYAATMNIHSPLRCRAIAVGAQTQLAAIIRLVEQAQGSKAAIQKLADKISTIFVPVVVLIAFITLIAWWSNVLLSVALMNAVAVLVISCPCALGLATPTALVVATGRAAQLGILIKNADALERAHKLTTLVVDKTGTLTEGKPCVTDVMPIGIEKQQLLQQAAWLAQSSTHPLSRAIVSASPSPQVVAEQISELPGQGLSAQSQGKHYKLGAPLWVCGTPDEKLLAPLRAQGKTVIALACDDKLLGYIALADPLRDTSRNAVQRLLSMGVQVIMLSGDHYASAQHIAGQLGINEFHAEVLPQDKAAKIEALKASQRLIGMVGDGINDAPALAAADIGFAMRSGSDIAIATADITLMRNDLNSVVDAIALSHATMRKIKQNLFFAFFYNVLGIPLAAAGMLNPMIAGAAMALSSVSVVTNALTLRRWHG